MISGIITASLLLAFLAITAWAWSARNRARFDDASRLPLREDGVDCTAPCCCQEKQP